MKFLRRSGRDDELPVDPDEAPPDDALDDDEDGSAEPVEALDAAAAQQPDDPGAEAQAGTIWAAPERTGPAAALGELGDSDSAPGDDETPLAVEAAASGAADVSEGDADLGEAGDAEPTALAGEDAPLEDAPLEDAEGLAGLVAGGVGSAVAPAPVADGTGPDPLDGGRPAALRIAGLHLRTGQHALARAQLEALAGRSRLDDEALLDLAEVRWRTGDLAGAGETANALLARGCESPLALVIAAEAVAAAGRPMEARRLSARALEVMDGPLDPLFAGMPRAMIWPASVAPEPGESPRRRARRPRAEGDGAPTTASEAFAGGRAALARGDANRAGLLLGVAMRLEPGFAEDVLRAVSGRDDQPLLALVRGDALRLLGREAEALEAFDRARGRSAAGSAAAEEHTGPGLFDEDGV